jgi:hypothetical protein
VKTGVFEKCGISVYISLLIKCAHSCINTQKEKNENTNTIIIQNGVHETQMGKQ